jgi:hypothetical protein
MPKTTCIEIPQEEQAQMLAALRQRATSWRRRYRASSTILVCSMSQAACGIWTKMAARCWPRSRGRGPAKCS